MLIRMTRTTRGAANEKGSEAMSYMAGSEHDMAEPWQQRLAETFCETGAAVEMKPGHASAETKVGPRRITAGDLHRGTAAS